MAPRLRTLQAAEAVAAVVLGAGGLADLLLPLAIGDQALVDEDAVAALFRDIGRGVDELAVDDHREVQVRSGRAAARADITDQVALFDAAARAHAVGESWLGVQRLEVVGVADLHRAAVVEVPALVIEDAVGRRIDRHAGLALEIDAVVEATAGRTAVVAAGAERRGDARAAARLGQRRAAKATATFVEPAFRLVGRREPPERLLLRPFADAGGEEPRRPIDRAALPDLDLGVALEASQGLGELLEGGGAGAGRGKRLVARPELALTFTRPTEPATTERAAAPCVVVVLGRLDTRSSSFSVALGASLKP